MPLVYAFVCRDATVLAEYATHTGDFKNVAIQCLEKCPAEKSKFTFTCDGHTLNYRIESGYTFLAVADHAFGRQVPFAFLEKTQHFLQKFKDEGRVATAHSLDKPFKPMLKKNMEFCMEHPQELTKTAAVQKQVGDVKNILVQNIESVLDRQVKLGILVEKTDDLKYSADNFKKTSQQVRRKMWWVNMKMKLLVIFLVLVLVFVLHWSRLLPQALRSLPLIHVVVCLFALKSHFHSGMCTAFCCKSGGHSDESVVQQIASVWLVQASGTYMGCMYH